MAEPTIESAGELMKHPRIRLLVVTGGGAVVAAAMNSGKRAICAGPGNPPAVVDETADIEKAGRDIVFGHSFDNNVICTDEKEVIAVDSIADALKGAMKKAGAFELPAARAPAPREGDLREGGRAARPRGGQQEVHRQGRVGDPAASWASRRGPRCGRSSWRCRTSTRSSGPSR